MPPWDDTGLRHLIARLSDGSIRRHFLAPLAYRLGNARFQKDFAAATLLAEYREQALTETLTTFAERSIPVVLLKGASYADTLYSDPGERPMSDLDLMVERHRREDAARALRNLGYWNAGPAISSGRNYHAITFKRRNGAVDLHWTIVQPWRSRIDVPALWRRAGAAVERKDGALRLDPVDEAVLHLAHIARSELRVPLINYVDAVRLLATTGTKPVIERASHFRLGRGARAAVDMTNALMGGQAFTSRLLPSPDDIIDEHMAPRASVIIHKLALLEGPREWIGLGVAYVQNLLGR